MNNLNKLIFLFIGAAIAINSANAEIIKCKNKDAQYIFTDNKEQCVSNIETVVVNVKKNSAQVQSKNNVFPKNYNIPNYNDFYLGATFDELSKKYSKRLGETTEVTYVKHLSTVRKYRIDGEDILSSWMELYFYEDTLYRIEAYFKDIVFDAAGNSEGILAKLDKIYGPPHMTGDAVVQSKRYGQWVPWIHESFRWNFDNNYSSVLLMSSNEYERAHIQLQINNFEEKVEKDVQEYLRKKLQ